MEGHMQEGYPAEGEGRAEVAVGIFVWEFMDGNFRVEAIRVALFSSDTQPIIYMV